jgi:hypothetical protein
MWCVFLLMRQLDQPRSQGKMALFKQPQGPGRGSGHLPAFSVEKLLHRGNCGGKRGKDAQPAGCVCGAGVDNTGGQPLVEPCTYIGGGDPSFAGCALLWPTWGSPHHATPDSI